jgi:hypothetical protein
MDSAFARPHIVLLLLLCSGFVVFSHAAAITDPGEGTSRVSPLFSRKIRCSCTTDRVFRRDSCFEFSAFSFFEESFLGEVQGYEISRIWMILPRIWMWMNMKSLGFG